MALSGESQLVSFDVEAAVERGRELAGESLLTAVEYTDEEWNALYVADSVLAMYENEDHMTAHFQKIHEHNYVDTQEQSLLEQELNEVGEVRYFLTQMTHAAMIRLTGPETGSGLWVTVQDDASPVDVAEELRDALET